jgi:hypothetical protein
VDRASFRLLECQPAGEDMAEVGAQILDHVLRHRHVRVVSAKYRGHPLLPEFALSQNPKPKK